MMQAEQAYFEQFTGDTDLSICSLCKKAMTDNHVHLAIYTGEQYQYCIAMDKDVYRIARFNPQEIRLVSNAS